MMFLKTWNMLWDDVLRDVLWPDETLRNLMMIPDGTDIVTWTDRYFVDGAVCTEIVRDEDVRVLWYEEQSTRTTNPVIALRKIVFDIYVKTSELRTAGNDLLRSRAKMIALRIAELLTAKDVVGGIAWRYGDDYSIGTKMVGYARYHLEMTYLAPHINNR